MKMTAIKNYYVYNTNEEVLKRLRDEYEFIGRECSLDTATGTLVVYALPTKRKTKPVKKFVRKVEEDDD